jgi:hypothetical protein
MLPEHVRASCSESTELLKLKGGGMYNYHRFLKGQTRIII